MKATAFLPMFLFAVSLPVLGCIPDDLSKKSPIGSAVDKAKKEKAVKPSKAALAGKEKKEEAVEVDLSYLEQTWGIQCKSRTTADGDKNCKQMTFLLEFTKDVENLKELREAFTAINNIPTAPLVFYLFNDGNRPSGQITLAKIEGEVTGKKGDTIRVSTHLIAESHFNRIRQIKASRGEKEKATDGEKKDAIKVDLSYLENTWGLKCKSCKITPPEPRFFEGPAGKDKSGKTQKTRREPLGESPAKVKCLTEFTKDVENLKELQDTLKYMPSIGNTPPATPLFYFFDEENVSLGTIPLINWSGYMSIEGGVTGKKGDAIRMTLIIPETFFKNTRKIELRPGEEKAKK